MRRPAGIYKRGRIYWVTYMLKGRQQFESSHSSELCVATDLLRSRRHQISAGRIDINPSKAPCLSEAIRLYITSEIENANTRKRYELAGKILVQYLGDPRISQLSAAEFDRFKHERRASGLTPAGVNRELALARACLNLAVERRLIPFSPFAGVKLFEEPEPWPREISFAEERRILECCELRLRTLVTLLVESGLRVGIEALPIKWSEINFGEGTIKVIRSKTAAGRRMIPMTRLCKSVLLEWHAATKGKSEYVFFNPQNPVKHIKSVKTAWHNALRAAAISPFAIYSCRHTFSTRLLAAGVPNAIVDQLIGHGGRRGDVLRFYSARVMEYLRDAIRDLEELRKTKESALKIRGAIDESAHITKGSELIQ